MRSIGPQAAHDGSKGMADQGARNIDGVNCRRGTSHPQSTSPLRGQISNKVVFLSTFNKSCDACGNKKRKCDGAHPCRRCVGNGEGHSCRYSRRRARTPRIYNTNPTPASAICREAFVPELIGNDALGHDANSGGGGMPSLKRCRLSASPATGLVGMQENTFLGDFFGCIGFLPLTSRGQIRETIIVMMNDSNWRCETNDEQVFRDTSSTLVERASRDTILGGNGLDMGPSMCIFWCACALGALVTGRLNDSVKGYFHMARTALDTSMGPPTAEVARQVDHQGFINIVLGAFSSLHFGVCNLLGVALGYELIPRGTQRIKIPLPRPDGLHGFPLRAWTSLAYVNGFMGDMDGFRGYLQRAEAFVVECEETGREDVLPAGFAEIVKSGDNAKAYAGHLDVRALRGEDSPTAPEMGEFPTEGELFRFCFVVSRKMLAPALFGIVDEHKDILKGLADGGMNETWSSAERAVATPTTGEESGRNWNSHMVTHQRSFGQSRVLDELEAKLKHSWSAFQRLEQAAKRTLAVVKAIMRDQQGVLESTRRSIEVVERYPGLLHFVMGLHDAHLFAALVATIDDPEAGELYDRVRALFNATRPFGWKSIPPLEEWQGVSACCDHAHCRSMGMVLDMSSLRARRNENPPIRGNVRIAPKWTRTSIGARKAHEHGERDGPSVTGGAACGLYERVNPQRPSMAARGLGVTHSQTELYDTSCNTYTTSGSDLSTSWSEMRRATANVHHDSSIIGVEDWIGGDNVMDTGAAPNTALNSVASVAQSIQQHKLEPESDDAIAAEDWSAVANALLHPIS